MKAGIIGLPASGKKTLFELIRKTMGAATPATAATNLSVIKVPDVRLDHLTEMYKPKKTTPAVIELTCLPSIYGEEDHKRQVLVALGDCDLIVLVVRAFKNENVYHVHNSVDPQRDIDGILSDLLLADLYRIEKRIEKLELEIRKKKDELKSKELELQKKFKAALEQEKPLRDLTPPTEDEMKMIRGFQFFTLKNVLIVLNITDDTDETADATVAACLKRFESDKVGVIALKTKLESEIADLSGDDRQMFLNELGIKEIGLTKIVREVYRLLGLITFFTVGEDEVRAWPLKKGFNAQKAAGEIHSDIERGFIRAETMKYDELQEAGSANKLKELGKLYLKGKEYIVEDGDIANFRFNV